MATLYHAWRHILAKKNMVLLLAAGCCLVAALCVAVLMNYHEERNPAHSTSVVKSRGITSRDNAGRRPDEDDIGRHAHISLEKLRMAWQSADRNAQGKELIRQRATIIVEAANKLRGFELAEFLDIVINSGNFEEYTVQVIFAAQSLFGNADEALQYKLAENWLSGISHHDARERLAYNLGISYWGKDIGGVLGLFNDLKTKQVVLDAYCIKMASYNPCEAFRVYQANLPKGGDYSGLSVIAANMSTGFGEFLAMLPSDERSLVSKAREEALKSWGSQSPLDAAKFVRGNPDKIKPSYMKSVMATWMGSDPSAAIAWAQNEQDPVFRENSFRGIVDSWKGAEPQKAWELILGEPGIDSVKEELLKQIHAEWIKADPKAAEAARIGYQTSLKSR